MAGTSGAADRFAKGSNGFHCLHHSMMFRTVLSRPARSRYE